MKPLRPLIPAAVLLAATAVFWYKLLAGSAFFFGLTTEYFQPIYSFLSQSVRGHLMPLWNPFVMGGLPFIANPQSAAYYPFSYIFVLLPFPDAFSASLLLHTFLAGLFMYLLALGTGTGQFGSIGAAFIYMFNGYFVFHFEFISNTSSYIWAPVILLFFRRALDTRALDRPTGVNAAAAGFFLAMQLFAGHPQFVYYTAGLMLVYAAVFSPVKGARALPAACMVFLGLAAAQIIPTLELLSFTTRAQGLDYAASTVYSVRPADMLRFLFVPLWDIFNRVYEGDPHIIAFYFGVIPLAAVAASFFTKPTKQQFFYAGIFIFAMLAALGKYFPLYHLLMKTVPGWKFFKFPGQVVFLAAFSFSLLFGFAVDKARSISVKAGLILLCFAELLFFGLKANPLIDRSFYSVKTPNIEFLKENTADRLARFTMAPQVRDMEPEKAATEYQYWLNYKDMLLPNSGAAHGLFCTEGRETLKLKDFTETLDAVKSPDSPVLDLLNVKYLLLPWNKTAGNLRLVKKGYINIFLNTDHMQRFSLVDRSVMMKEGEVTGYMGGNFDPRKEVLIGVAPGPIGFYGKDSLVSGPDFITVDNYSINAVDLTVNTRRARWLLASESYYPGWKAEVDGEKAEIYRADHSLRALPVKKGLHKIRMFYDPWTVKAGQAVSVLTLAGLLFWFLKKFFKGIPGV